MIDNKELREFIITQGATFCGFADISILTEEGRYGMGFGIAIGIAVAPKIVADIPLGPSTGYFEEYDKLNAKLDEISISVANYLSERGQKAIAQTVAYSQKERKMHPKHYAPVPHKTVAALAGLGWISKSSMLITREYGSAVRITSVLTDVPIETTSYEYKCLCGSCRICVDLCPGNAIKNNQWYAGIDREELVSISECRKVVIDRGKPFGRDRTTCRICMAECPYTKKYTNSR